MKLGGEIGKGRERAAKLQNGSARTHKVLVTGHAGLRNRGHTCAVGRSQSASLREKKESTLIEQLRNEKRKKEKKEKKVGENNGQLCFVRHDGWHTQARLDQ